MEKGQRVNVILVVPSHFVSSTNNANGCRFHFGNSFIWKWSGVQSSHRTNLASVTAYSEPGVARISSYELFGLLNNFHRKTAIDACSPKAAAGHSEGLFY